MIQDPFPYKSFHEILEEQAIRFGDKIYIESIDQGRSLSFSDMNKYCNRVANFLNEVGLNRGETITLVGKNSLETLIIFFGVLKHGAIINPINSEESPRNIWRCIRRVRPHLVIWDSHAKVDLPENSFPSICFHDLNSAEAPRDSFFVRLQDMATDFQGPEGTQADIAEILFTSGTTELPKAVVISRRRLYLMAEEVVDRIEVTPKDRILEYRSYSWASAQLLTIMSAMIAGATLVLGKKFSRSKFACWLKDHNITKSAGVPTVFNILVADPINLHQRDVPQLQFVTSSAAPLSLQTLEKFEAMYGITIRQMAGMTEAGWMMGNPLRKRKAGSVGTPFKHKKVCIKRLDGSECAEGEEGEIVIDGESMADGYLNADGTVEPFPRTGFQTGDIGYVDSEGYVFITGRKKDLINRGGVNISPAEVNDVLLKHPAIQEAATVGAPDPTYGEEVVSLVVLQRGKQSSEQEILTYCRGSLPAFKVPKHVHFVESIPNQSNGKVSREQLLRMIRAMEAVKAFA